MNPTKLIDLSHTVEDGLVTYKGLPAPIICDFLSREASRAHYADGTSFQIGKIEMVANTGTYVDAPFHRHADGEDISELALATLAGVEGVVIHADPTKLAIDEAAFRDKPLAGKAVLINTGWSKHWNTEQYYEDHPYLTQGAAELLRDQGVTIVGIDSHNIDDVADTSRPVHTALLGAGIPIIEHMCQLGNLPDQGFRLYAVPVKVKGFGTFPVRAFAEVDAR